MYSIQPGLSYYRYTDLEATVSKKLIIIEIGLYLS